ncbi:MAG: hypothetical protein ACFFCY_18275 [Promethearchaeota archaeon]
MKILPADLPESYIRSIEEILEGDCFNRPEHIRLAIRELIRDNFLKTRDT